MTEETAFYTEELSQSDSNIPLSPVLGSGQAVKKFLRNRKRSKHAQILPHKPALEEVPTMVNQTDNILNRIKHLETVQLQESHIISSISLNAIVPPIEANVLPSTSSIDDVICKSSTIITKDKSHATGPTSFLTCTGKEIAISDLKVQSSKKLFEDILGPHSNSNPRKNKYNYLHKCGFVPPVHKPASTNLGYKNMLLEDRNVMTKPNLHLKSNNVFEGENFSDLSTNEAVCFQPASVNASQLLSANKDNGFKLASINLGKQSNNNIFEGEKFDNLNLKQAMGLEPASARLALDCKSDKVSPKPQVKLSNALTLKGPKNVFADENFDDLKLERSQFKVISKSQMRNIFESENFDNLNLKQQISFQPASGRLLQDCKNEQITSKLSNLSTFKGVRRTIFADENFDDLKPECSQFKVISKNIFESENFDDLNLKQQISFEPASTRLVRDCKNEQITSKSQSSNFSTLKGLKTMTIDDLKPELAQFKTSSKTQLKNIFESENFDDMDLKQITFEPASTRLVRDCKSEKITSKSKSNNLPTLKGPRNIFADENFDDLKLGIVQCKTISKTQPRNIFEGENLDDLNLNLGQFQAASGPQANSSCSKRVKHIFEGENVDDLNLAGLGFAKSTTLKRKGRPNSFQTPYKTPIKLDNSFHGFTREEQQYSKQISQNIFQLSRAIGDRFQLIINTPSNFLPLFMLKDIKRFTNNTMSRKRKFSEVDSDHNLTNSNTPLQTSVSKRSKRRLGCPFSPTIAVSESGLKRAKQLFEDLEPKSIVTSTPLKFGGDLARPLPCDLTPISAIKKNAVPSFLNQSLDVTLTNDNNRFSLNKPSQGDVRVWLENLAQKRRLLEEQLKIIDEKQKILINQKNIMDVSRKRCISSLPGVLYRTKTSQFKVHLQDYVHRISPGENSNDSSLINQINPQNAHLVHFYVCDRSLSHIKTEDRATIVPTIDGRIGLSEIEHCFQLMDGVDPSLIHDSWIRNHYKWIVWKLASYERMFANQFEGCLCVENVMKQLKYRYDVEIDNANRPILRKIFEKDDCSERRMVLCVSNIIKVNDSYELELTDGWYPIRTLIDQPLCNQITKRKIHVGGKLIVYGAKLTNCEGCHPLEAPDSVYLKINYNCTRRALWWCKLGCQKASGPFQVPISSVNMDGGKVGCIRCFISRVYPVKYLEKCGNRNVWRNRKAEERREQQFHNKNLSVSDRSNNYKDLKGIDDPVILYDIMQRNDDAEALQEMLSTTQKTMLYNYSINKPTSTYPTRSVTAALKLKIVDASCNADEVYDFHIWRPGEEHLQELKEGQIVSILNVSCSPKWGLSASQSTQFRTEAKAKDDRFLKFRRKVTEICFLKQTHCISNEFDTVGLVIEKRIDDTEQVCWMSDCNQNLLLIKIYDSPKNILALDMVNEGQIISVCNLMLKLALNTHSYAIADHSVVFARYSQHKHLQDGLEKLEEDFVNVERNRFIRDCQSKIQQIESNRKPYLEMDEMECSQITMTDMALLECVEKLT